MNAKTIIALAVLTPWLAHGGEPIPADFSIDWSTIDGGGDLDHGSSDHPRADAADRPRPAEHRDEDHLARPHPVDVGGRDDPLRRRRQNAAHTAQRGANDASADGNRRGISVGWHCLSVLNRALIEGDEYARRDQARRAARITAFRTCAPVSSKRRASSARSTP